MTLKNYERNDHLSVGDHLEDLLQRCHHLLKHAVHLRVRVDTGDKKKHKSGLMYIFFWNHSSGFKKKMMPMMPMMLMLRLVMLMLMKILLMLMMTT